MAMVKVRSRTDYGMDEEVTVGGRYHKKQDSR